MRRWPLLILASVTAAVVASSVSVAAMGADAASGSPPLLHAAAPTAPIAAGTTTVPAAATSSGSTVVTFRYAPQVLVQLDAHGRPWRVKTNTGKAPARTDQLDLADASGTPIEVTDAIRAAVTHATWSGDWSEVGAWHPWP